MLSFSHQHKLLMAPFKSEGIQAYHSRHRLGTAKYKRLLRLICSNYGQSVENANNNIIQRYKDAALPSVNILKPTLFDNIRPKRSRRRPSSLALDQAKECLNKFHTVWKPPFGSNDALRYVRGQSRSANAHASSASIDPAHVSIDNEHGRYPPGSMKRGKVG